MKKSIGLMLASLAIVFGDTRHNEYVVKHEPQSEADKQERLAKAELKRQRKKQKKKRLKTNENLHKTPQYVIWENEDFTYQIQMYIKG